MQTLFSGVFFLVPLNRNDWYQGWRMNGGKSTTVLCTYYIVICTEWKRTNESEGKWNKRMDPMDRTVHGDSLAGN